MYLPYKKTKTRTVSPFHFRLESPMPTMLGRSRNLL
jgi:hypothetical protein